MVALQRKCCLGSESGCGYPVLYFGKMKRDILPASCQDTLKRACQSAHPIGIHISYSLPFLLGKRFGRKTVPTSRSHPIHASFFIRLLCEGRIRCGNKMPNNYSVAKKHKKFISLLQAILFMDGSSHESRKFSHNQLMVFRATSASERGREIAEESCSRSCKHSPNGGS